MFPARFLGLAITLLGCSAGGENGAPQRQELGGSSAQGGAAGSAQNPEGGQAGESTTGGESGSTSSGGGSTWPDGSTCTTGQTQECHCAPGYLGEQVCTYGVGWAECVCEGGEGGTGGAEPEPGWPTCPRDPLDESTARYPNGCPIVWLPALFDEPACTAGTGADPNSGLCTFDCREWQPSCPEPHCGMVRVFNEGRRMRCLELGGDCSVDAPSCVP